jgi:Domain of unknown function (DUF4249)
VASTGIKPVTGATVTVEGDDNSNYLFTEATTGYYYYNGLNLDASHKYRLHIKTVDITDEYRSDFVPVRNTPPIDSIGFTVKSNGVQLYANAHDATNNTRYYKWDYEETWAFHSQYYSYFISNGSGIVDRPPDQQIYYCFGDQLSSDIVVGSSASLQNDVIYQNPIVFIPSASEKIETKYSILLKQYSLTADAFAFWTTLRKNTEGLGSIFDAQPSNINGNIHSVLHSSEGVIGYVSVCNVTTKRVFISNSQLPSAWQPTYPYQCVQDSFLFRDKSGVDQTTALIGLPNSELVTSAILNNGIAAGYLGADRQCVDCTLRGFTTAPSFWQY